MKKKVHYHQIQKQIFEITCGNEQVGFQITQQASNLLTSRLFRLTEAIMEELGTSATFVRIEQLVLDLGEVRADNWENEVVFRYEQAFRKELKKIIQEDNTFSPQQASSIRAKGSTLIELLDFYLKKGYLAWWCESSWKNEMGIAIPFSFTELFIHLGKTQRKSLAEWLNAHLENQAIITRIDAQITPQDLRKIVFALLPRHIGQEVINIQQDIANIFVQGFADTVPLLRILRVHLLQAVLEQQKNSHYFKESKWFLVLIQKSLDLKAQNTFWETLTRLQTKKDNPLRTRLFKMNQLKFGKQQQGNLLKIQWKNATNWEALAEWLKPKSSQFFWKTLFPSQFVAIKEVITLFTHIHWSSIQLKPITQRLASTHTLQIQAYLLAILWQNKSKTFNKEELIGLLLEQISPTISEKEQNQLFTQIIAKAPIHRELITQKRIQLATLPPQRSLEDWKAYLSQQGLGLEVLKQLNTAHSDFIFRYLTLITQLNPEIAPVELWANALMILQNQPRLALELFLQRHLRTISHPEPSELVAQLRAKMPTIGNFKLSDATPQPEKSNTLAALFNQPEPSPESLLAWLLGGKDLPLAVQLRMIFSEKEKERVSLETSLTDWIAQNPLKFETLVIKLKAENIDFGNVSLSFFSNQFRLLLLEKIKNIFPIFEAKMPDYRLNSDLLNHFLEVQSAEQGIFALIALIYAPSFDLNEAQNYLSDSRLSSTQKKILEDLLQKTKPLSKEALQQAALKALQEILLENLPTRVEKLVAILHLYLKNDTMILGDNINLKAFDANTRLLIEQTFQDTVLTYFERRFPKEFYFWVEALPLALREKAAKINPTLLEKTYKKIAQNQQKAHLEKIKKALSENQLKVKTIEALNEVYVQNIGLVLLHPFLSRLFSRLGYLENRAFKSSETAERAVHLLHYLAHKTEQPEEYELALNKIICGLTLETPIRKDLTLSAEEKEMAESLLVGVIQNWTVLKNTSADGLRASFLMREGKMSEYETFWQIQVAPKGIDVLLGQLPWGLSTFKLSWMEKIFQVDWQVP